MSSINNVNNQTNDNISESKSDFLNAWPPIQLKSLTPKIFNTEFKIPLVTPGGNPTADPAISSPELTEELENKLSKAI